MNSLFTSQYTTILHQAFFSFSMTLSNQQFRPPTELFTRERRQPVWWLQTSTEIDVGIYQVSVMHDSVDQHQSKDLGIDWAKPFSQVRHLRFHTGFICTHGKKGIQYSPAQLINNFWCQMWWEKTRREDRGTNFAEKTASLHEFMPMRLHFHRLQ